MWLLQSRPVTTVFAWSDWELEHELDTAQPSDREVISRGNLGEVFPGAVTPLTQSTVWRALDLGLAQAGAEKAGLGSYVVHTSSWLCNASHQGFLNLVTRF